MIKFGTSGWRAIIAEDFTFRNAAIASKAIARYLRKEGKEGGKIAVGCDTRFLSEKFAHSCAETLKEEGLKPVFLKGFTPTPVISFTIIRNRLDGAINITASHNPSEWSGIKFTTDKGMPAPPAVTKQIEAIAQEIIGSGEEIAYSTERSSVFEFDPKEDYLKKIESLIDLQTILNSKIKIAVDPFYGTTIGYIDEVLRRNGFPFGMIHQERDPYFGGMTPEPSKANLAELQTFLVEGKYDLGVALDGDGDRFGFLDRDGEFVNPNLILGLLTDYLITTRDWKTGVGLSVATGHLMKEVAKKNGIPVYITPVGFKYLGDMITEGKAFIVGEESAGMSVRGHIPEKDGIIAALLVSEMVARTKKSLKELQKDLFMRVGYFFNQRINLSLTEEAQERLDEKLKFLPERIARKRIAEIDEMDGVKIILDDGSWLLFRKSGTEPIVRLYVEAHSQPDLEELAEEGRKIIFD